MKPEGSSPYSQEFPYSELDRSSLSPPPPQSNLSKIHFNIILPPTPGPSKWSPSLIFPHQNPECTPTIPHTCYVSCPSQSSSLDHPNDISWRVQSIKLLVMKSSLIIFLRLIFILINFVCNQIYVVFSFFFFSSQSSYNLTTVLLWSLRIAFKRNLVGLIIVYNWHTRLPTLPMCFYNTVPPCTIKVISAYSK
jgi:hypothetical protein